MFKQLITDLRRKGVNQTRIAAELGISQATVSRLAAGKTSVRYDTGVALIQLAARELTRNAAPTQKPQAQEASS